MRRSIRTAVVMWTVVCLAATAAAAAPNVLFIIADDASCHFSEAYACPW